MTPQTLRAKANGKQSKPAPARGRSASATAAEDGMPPPETTKDRTMTAPSAEHFELMSATKMFKTYLHATENSLADVLAPGYLDSAADAGFWVLDRAEVSALIRGTPEHALLVITEKRTRPEGGVTFAVERIR